MLPTASRARISLIAAVAADGLMGFNPQDGGPGRIPWRRPADLAFFKRRTADGVVVMGRRTWDSLPTVQRDGKPHKLPGRAKIVVSGTLTPSLEGPRATVASTLREALQFGVSHTGKHVWLIGGAGVYREALRAGWVGRIILTRVPDTPRPRDGEAPVYFPHDALCWDDWALIGQSSPPEDPTIRFEVYRPRPGCYASGEKSP